MYIVMSDSFCWVYEITDLLRLENMLEMGSVYRKIDKKVMNLEPLNNE